MLTSLHIVINDSTTGLDDISCQIIAEAILKLAHFGVRFRRQSGMPLRRPIDHRIDFTNNNPNIRIVYDEPVQDWATVKSIYDSYEATIKKLQSCILRLSSVMKPLIVVEEGGCGLTVWF